MDSRLRAPLLLALLAATQLSCAAGLTPLPHSMPAARAALLPEHRIFYDALEEYGDWTLIEPHGYVFRPRVATAHWRPYGDGFWVPTDSYGWVWVSSEPFGWATYHYGRWFHDSFQGWVWLPGVDWGPAWVDWRATDSFVGWAPRMPAGASRAAIPGGAFTYAPVSQLGTTQLAQYAMTEGQLGDVVAAAEPVDNLDRVDGVLIDRGPALGWVERRVGPLPRARLEDLVPPASERARREAGRRFQDAGLGRDRADTVSAVQRAAERAATEARDRSRIEGKWAWPLPVVRPVGVPPAAEEARPPAAKPDPLRGAARRKGAAPRDTTR